jgi:hypothetical protein
MIEVCSFQRAQQRRCLPPPHLRKETGPVTDMLYCLQYRTMDEVQKANNPEKSIKKVKLSLCLTN